MTNKLKALIRKKKGHKLGLIGIAYDQSSSFLKGAAQAPPLIRKAFHTPASNYWSELGIQIDPETILFDTGDWPCSQENMFSRIEQLITVLVQSGLVPLCLGGDHSITYPIIQALSKQFSQVSILHFDAHPDLYDRFENSRFSHACPFARIMENRLVSRLVQVGIRTMNDHQQLQGRKFAVETFAMKDWQEGVEFEFKNPLYISFDVDVLDPAFAPGTSHNEPGGLSTRQVLRVLHHLKAPAIIGADIVEFNPGRDVNGMTASVCAKVLKEIAAKIIISNNP